MGNKLYAIEKVLDPKGVLFNGRVLLRGDDGDSDGDPKRKDLEGILGIESFVVAYCVLVTTTICKEVKWLRLVSPLSTVEIRASPIKPVPVMGIWQRVKFENHHTIRYGNYGHFRPDANDP
ncbi:unnamed protein product [Lactuca saligna]|uniref:Uncharacterized protein n=1 Tax=Lactuca saligna TaxID=75948 RepID=A0AA35VS15_LACSI|nr:unnamed protein product [Lactuca saligna]